MAPSLLHHRRSGSGFEPVRHWAQELAVDLVGPVAALDPGLGLVVVGLEVDPVPALEFEAVVVLELGDSELDPGPALEMVTVAVLAAALGLDSGSG